jgi:DNA-binding transcriptional LysR family regulator
LIRFREKYPRILLEVSFSNRHAKLIEEGFDIALRAGRLEDSSLVARKIGGTAFGLFASPSYLKRRGVPNAPEDLARHEFVAVRGRDGRARLELNGPNGAIEIDVNAPLTTDDLSFIFRAVSLGAGIGLIPIVFTALKAEHDLVRVLPEYGYAGAALYIVMPSSTHVPARVALLRDFLLAELSKLPLG